MLAGYEYELYEIPPNSVREFLTSGDFDGLNVTIPYKKTVLPLCKTLSDAARRTGSVNTIIRNGDGTLHGENTDYYGFKFLLDRAGADVRGKKSLILGNGGAASAVRAVLEDGRAGEIVTISRGGQDNYGNIVKHSDARIVINTTPVGMYPENGVSPVSPDIFKSCEAVIDVIYNPSKTELMLQAEDLAITCIGGLYMLVAQAKRACELFTGANIRDAVIEGIAEKIGGKIKNIALIGMPGCGKTTVGGRLAELTGREFYDIDEMIRIRAGKPAERLLADVGEEAFRDIEEAELKEVSKKSGCVVATGGGTVKREANRRRLRQNSIIVYLDRPAGELPSAGRPLSVQYGVDALYRERAPLYSEWCDFRIPTGDGAEETARAVLKVLSVEC